MTGQTKRRTAHRFFSRQSMVTVVPIAALVLASAAGEIGAAERRMRDHSATCR